MTLQAAVREIAEKLVLSFSELQLGYTDEQAEERAKRACYAAIKAFAEQEPNERTIDAGFSATAWPELGRQTPSYVIAGLRRNMAKEFSAMLAQAVKEMEET